MRLARHLLWIDCVAAALAGTLMLALGDRLADLYAMPMDWLRFIGAINLLYACFSGSLALRRRRPVALVAALSIANTTWSMTCLGIAVVMAGTATVYGMMQLLGEAVFVGSLAMLEWRWRHRLVSD